MEKFIRHGIRRPYISAKPKKQQLYFLYKLIMNRKKFQFDFVDRTLNRLSFLFCCCRKKLLEKWCSERLFSTAEKRSRQFQKGQRKLTRDLDIVTLIQRQQMHDVSKQVLYKPAERFLLQYQRRNVIESNSDSTIENQKHKQHYHWKNLLLHERRQEF